MGNSGDELDLQSQQALRRGKLAAWRETGRAYRNDFAVDAWAKTCHGTHGDWDTEALAQAGLQVRMAGRMMTRRVMGKASFMHLQDTTGRMQCYVKCDDLPEGQYAAFKQWDLGDIVAVVGTLFKTKTGELSVHASEVVLLSKALHPLPDKYHGLQDQEQRFRQRYLDLMANPQVQQLFRTRSLIIDTVRQFLLSHRFLEVETPMMQALAGGAAARPFVTHHNALDMPLYLRIAPELYLKRLVVGGFDRVFEINRNFRNEGVSARHNPEFTMVEFYQAYARYEDLMDLTEALIRELVRVVHGGSALSYQGHAFDVSKSFARMTVLEAICVHNEGVTETQLKDMVQLKALADRLAVPYQQGDGMGKIQIEIFEKTVEKQLHAPTFITAYPTEVSPLARRNDDDPTVTDRFEFFVGGQEIANGFSELNDPEDQAERFEAQMHARAGGDDEAMPYDEDYVTALAYGMPPTAGEGIGIDRLVMLLTDSASIRDVILFPLMRPKS